jgi:hypothetical protein
MTIGHALKSEIAELATACLLGEYSDAYSIRDAVRTVAKAHGIGTGYVYSRMTDFIKQAEQLNAN